MSKTQVLKRWRRYRFPDEQSKGTSKPEDQDAQTVTKRIKMYQEGQ